MKKLYTIIFTIVLMAFLVPDSYSQGCVAIRGSSGCGIGQSTNLHKGEWLISTNFRYFQSFRHFKGNHEEKHRLEEGSEVINDSYFLDFTVSFALTDRLFGTFSIPFVYHERSSMYEHGGTPPDWLGERNKTYSEGLGDIRLGINYWLLDPEKISSSNIMAGVGIKLPTGDNKAEGTFYNPTRTAHLDQSIQPGDGGFGATIDVQGFHALNHNFTLTGNLYYLINPREKYEVTNFLGSSSDISVPDQYAARLGALAVLPVKGFSFYGGGRLEGVPSSDLIGGDEGFRRPGYVISLEPGLNYNSKNISVNLSVPVAVERNRTKSYSDKQNGGHGDAAFADYLINFSFSYRINKAPMANNIDVQ